jgi:hypothetical protein
MLRALLLSAIAFATTVIIRADPPPAIFFSASQDDRFPHNPMLFLNSGQAGTFFAYAQLGTGASITALDMSLSTPTPNLATPGKSFVANPFVSTPEGLQDRWDGFFEGAAFISTTAGTSPGLNGVLQTNDPTYDPNTNTYLIGSFPFQANNFPGQRKKIFTSLFLGGTIPGGRIQVGIGDPTIMSGGTSVIQDAYIKINDPSSNVLAGDYNDNGVVDVTDYVVWRDSFGTNQPLNNRDPSASGAVDQSDYDVWRANFGATASTMAPSSSAGAVETFNGAGPGIQVVDQGLTTDGNHSYLFRVASSDITGAYAVELGISGPIVDVKALTARVNDHSSALANDGLNGYQMEEDTWYDDLVFPFVNRGHNPFTNTITPGFVANYDAGQLFVALGSGVNNGPVADLLQIVVRPDAAASFTGTVAQGGVSFPVSATFQVPEPGATALTLLAAGMLCPRRRC